MSKRISLRFIGVFFGLPLITLLIYWPGLQGGFILDDFPNLVDSESWKVSSLAWNAWHTAILSGDSSLIGRPLSMLSFALNHYFSGLNPYYFKLTNVLLHVVNGVLVFFFLHRIFALVPAADRRTRLSSTATFVIALAWLIHPLQVSTVLYVVQRMEILAHTFVLLALLSYLVARVRQIAGRRAMPWFCLAAICIVLGLMNKESALLAPGYALMIEVCVLHFRGPEGRRSRGLIGAYGVGLLLATVAFALLILPTYGSSTAYAFRDFTLAERLLTQLRVLTMYLGQAVLPLPQTLLFYYDNFPVSTGLFLPPATFASLCLLFSLLGAGVLCLKRAPLVSLGIGWFFVAHALTSNVVPLELAFEHRNYFALLGVLIGLSTVIAWLTRSLHTNARWMLASVLIAFLGGFCVIQVRTWADPLGLSLALEARNRMSPRASYELGRQFLAISQGDTQSPMYNFAEQQFRQAAALPNSPILADQALLILLSTSGRPIDAKVWAALDAKLTRRAAGPQELMSLYWLSNCVTETRCKSIAPQLMNAFIVALESNPTSATLHTLYANFAYNVIGDAVLAIAMAREAIRLAPSDPVNRINLAKMLLATGGNPQEISDLLANATRQDRLGLHRTEIAELTVRQTALHDDPATHQPATHQ